MEVLILLLVGVAVFAFLVSYFGKSKPVVSETNENNAELENQIDEECCGAHEVCETDLIAKLNAEVVYFEDQELDAYVNFEEKDFSDPQIDEFREILYSLKETEIEEWVHSLEMRRINIPSIIKSELVFMLMKA